MRLLRLLSLLLVSGALLGLGCSVPLQQTDARLEGTAPYLAVMSAYSPEMSRLLADADLRDSCVVHGRTYHRGTLAGKNVILLLSGIGLENAAATTQTLLDSFDVAGIVFSGIAGGINPNLRIGDVTVPSQWGWADGPAGPDDEDFWTQVDPGMLKVASTVSSTVTLARCTRDSVCLEHTPAVVVGGHGISNSFFVDDPAYREYLWGAFEANAVDMETSAVARVASSRSVPFIAFRSLSDLAGGGPGENEIHTFFQLAADNAAVVVTAFLEAWEVRDPGTDAGP